MAKKKVTTKKAAEKQPEQTQPEQTQPEQPQPEVEQPEQPQVEQTQKKAAHRLCPECGQWPHNKKPVCTCGYVFPAKSKPAKKKPAQKAPRATQQPPQANGLASQIKAARGLIEATGGVDQAIEVLRAFK